MKILKSKANFTSPYHSVGNPAERPLRHLQALLRIWVNCDHYFDEKTQTWTNSPPRETHENFSKYGAWPEYLPFVISAYNASPKPGTDISPFEVFFGRLNRLDSDGNLIDTSLLEHESSPQKQIGTRSKKYLRNSMTRFGVYTESMPPSVNCDKLWTTCTDEEFDVKALSCCDRESDENLVEIFDLESRDLLLFRNLIATAKWMTEA